MRFSLSNLGAAVPDLVVASGFLITWVAPFTLGQKMVAYLMLVMLLEFLIIHSAGFMGVIVFNAGRTAGQKVWPLLGLGAFYALFAAAFSAMFAAWWPLWTIIALTLNRILGGFLGQAPSEEKRRRIKKGWVTEVLLYVLLTFLTLFPLVPELGITDEVVRLQEIPGEGLWIEKPHHVIAFGFLYFLGTGLSELFGHGWIPDSSMP